MKKIIPSCVLLTIIPLAVAFSAEHYDNITCTHAVGYTSSSTHQLVGSKNPSASATRSLQDILLSIPEESHAGFSMSFNKYVTIYNKKVSELTIGTQAVSMMEYDCGHDPENTSGIYKIVPCYQATACITMSLLYDECKKVTFDPVSGKKSVTCPDGQVIGAF